MVTPDHLYIDLALLKDLQIGAILALASRESEERFEAAYQAVSKGLKKYATRYFLDASHYFTKAGYTKAQIDEALADPTMSDDIYRMAPMTEFIKILFSHMLINANHSEVIGKSGEVSLTVNTYPLKLGEVYEAAVGVHLAELLGVKVVVWCKNLEKDVTMSDLKDFDEYYLWYLYEFSRNPEIHKGLSDMAFASKRIFATPTCGYVFDPDRSKDSLIRELVQVEAAMGVVVDTYKHIPIFKCSPSLPAPEEPQT